MKPKLLAKISEQRILGLSNDLSEDIVSGTVEEWRSVALYFIDKYYDEFYKVVTARDVLVLLNLSDVAKKHALKDAVKWLKKNKP